MKKILLIDDEQDFMEGISSILNYEGYKTLMAFNGEEGITLAKNEQPEIILCDILMPGLDGFDVLSQLKADLSLSLVPFIFITALDQKEKRRKGMEMGADDFLVKPFTRQELINTINARLRKQDGIRANIKDVKESIIYSIPHELKNPLNAIINFSHIIKEKANVLSADEISEMGEYIYRSGNHLNEIVQKYLTLIDIELNYQDKYFQEVKDLAFDITEITKTISKNYKRTQDYKMDIADCSVKVIKEWFLIALGEIIDNAFKFSKPGQKIFIEVRVKGIELEIQIHDEGRGFSPVNLNQINAFVQYDRKIFQQTGTGMGLFLAKRIVKIHKGTFTIKSLPGKGTDVCVVIPLK